LQFVVSSIKAENMLPSKIELEARYKFSGNYFLLPNQFWKHKNHQVVIEALGLLKCEDKKVTVLATGNPADYRHPEYFKSLMGRAKKLDVMDSFIFLGLVPASDLAGLMCNSLAIINPSFFEGWSTTVEEAKSLGKPILLSDIPVHREQNPTHGCYFSPNDAQALATLLWEFWNKMDTNEAEVIERAWRETDERRFKFARQFQDIVLRTVECN
jgi:glycosyltransferase involved in cell wall biosynthesis